MAALIGLSLAVAVAVFARFAGFDRERVFYPTVLIVVAHYYVLFAIVSGKHGAVPAQLIIFGLFSTLAVLGFRRSLWFAVAGLAAHGVFDFAQQFVAADSGVPEFWPSFCLSFDLAAAIGLAALLIIDRRHASRAAMCRAHVGGERPEQHSAQSR